MTCIPAGFGSGRWGKDPWGGSLAPVSGGPLPTVPPFDIYCVGPCGPISTFLSHPEVSTEGSGSQFPIDGMTMDQEINSGGSFVTSDAAVFVDVPVPENFTFEFTVKWESLPADFLDLRNRHAYFATSSSAAGCVGLFFSRIGVAYTGAVHLDGSNNLVLDSPVQDLPGSQAFVSEGDYWTVRVAMSFSTSVVYIYITKTVDLHTLGHQLRYIMPAIPSSSAALVPPSQTMLSVRGTATQPTLESLNSICLGSGVIIPGIPPVADAGTDKTIRTCSILELDGSRSYDPQNAPLTYRWRLIDAPLGSQYIFDGADGLTIPGSPPTGFTDRLYSVSLGVLNTMTPIMIGDVVVVQGQAHDIVTIGTDGTGFFVRIEAFLLPDNLSSNTGFKYIRQNGLNTSTSLKPTFYPDAPGFFKFDLVVFDGALYSIPAELVVGVVESVVARGCTPDLSFIWGYLSNFWNLVEDTERITTFWQGLAQVAAAEMLTLWQVDYSKSLRDIQRTFQRRWLHYDALMQESAALLELSTVRAIFGGVESVDIPTAGALGVSGTHLTLQIVGVPTPVVLAFMGSDPFTAVQAQAILQNTLSQIDSRFVVRILPNRAGTSSRLRIDAPFAFSVASSSTSPLFVVGASNAMPTGVIGVGIVSSGVYRVERSLQYLDIKSGDFLCIEGVAYRITRIVDDASDPFFFQRLLLTDPLPIPAESAWSISGTVTSKDLDFWSGLCEVSDLVTYEVLNTSTGALREVTGTVVGASSEVPGSLPVDATVVGIYLAQPATYSVFLRSVLRRKYIPLDPLIVDVPLLQENITTTTDDTQVLRRNADFFFDSFRGQPCLRFVTPVPANAGGPDVWQGQPPPDRLWAETSYLDNSSRIEANFGIPAQFTLDDLSLLPSNVDYLSVVRGLWYSYLNGPTLFNLRVGSQILLGLPFAEETGLIVQIRTDFSASSGQILIQDAADETVVREYKFPVVLPLEVNPSTNKPYKVGDTVQQFAPLVAGVEVVDWIKNPTWFQGYLQQGVFFEVEKYFKFLVQVDSVAFNLSALLFVKSFILRIKPTYTYPLFVVLAKVPDTEVAVSDLLQLSGTLSLFAGACFNGTGGEATMVDQPNPADGGWMSHFDSSPFVTPTYPTPTYPIVWGFDKNYLCPEDVIVGSACLTYSMATLPTMDSIYQVDEPVYTSVGAQFAEGSFTDVPVSPGKQIGGPQVIVSPGTLNTVSLDVYVLDPGNPNTYNLLIKKNGTTVATIPFTSGTGEVDLTSGVSIAVIGGDVLTCFVLSTTGSHISVFWSDILVTVGQSVTWAFDTTLPAGTYCSYREM